MPKYFTVVLLLWKHGVETLTYPVYHDLKGLHHSVSASFIVSPGRRQRLKFLLLGNAIQVLFSPKK
jgi:hypothetical protein